jgi:hypothetical protein
MSKDLWIQKHEQAIAEAMEANPNLDWSTAYNMDSTADRAQELYQDHYASLIDQARDRAKYDR